MIVIVIILSSLHPSQTNADSIDFSSINDICISQSSSYSCHFHFIPLHLINRFILAKKNYFKWYKLSSCDPHIHCRACASQEKSLYLKSFWYIFYYFFSLVSRFFLLLLLRRRRRLLLLLLVIYFDLTNKNNNTTYEINCQQNLLEQTTITNGILHSTTSNTSTFIHTHTSSRIHRYIRRIYIDEQVFLILTLKISKKTTVSSYYWTHPRDVFLFIISTQENVH